MELLFLYLFFSIDTASQLSLSKQYEASDFILKTIKSSTNVKYDYYRMINAFELNNKQDTIRYADYILSSFSSDGPVPLRYRDMAFILKAEAETWENKEDDLEDISREMRKGRNRLETGDAGENTRQIQKSVEERLKKMIDKIEEDRAKALADAQHQENQEGKEDQGSQIKPPPDTHGNTEKGTGVVESKKIKEIASVWGTLPEKERARALRDALRDMPPKDKAVVEKYFLELNRRTSKK